MTSLVELRDRVLLALGDAAGATWPDATVEGWITDAIKDYSKFLPRVILFNFSTGGDVTIVTHGLVDLQAVVSVRHHTAAGVFIRFVERKAYDTPEFINGSGYFYDVRRFRDIEPDRIVLSYTLPANEILYIEYQADHDWLTILDPGPAEALSVPPRDEPILIQYCVWCAWRERTGVEMANPDTSTLLISQMDTNAGRQKRLYDEMIKKAVGLSQSNSAMPTRWRMDKWENRY